MGFALCGFEGCFVPSGGCAVGDLAWYKSLPMFFVDENGSAVIHSFQWRLGFWGINITLEGRATDSLKNLAPLRKEKECSAEFLHCWMKKRKITLCEHTLGHHYE